jgi:hypothetical protein
VIAVRASRPAPHAPRDEPAKDAEQSRQPHLDPHDLIVHLDVVCNRVRQPTTRTVTPFSVHSSVTDDTKGAIWVRISAKRLLSLRSTSSFVDRWKGAPPEAVSRQR